MDLTSLDGIHRMTAQTILSEIGPDWSAFPTERHLASWLGLTPNKAFRGGKVVRAARKKVKNRVATALRTAATTLLHSQTYLGGRYRYLRKHWTEPAKAVKAKGPLPSAAGVSIAHQRPSLGGSRRRQIRGTAQALGDGTTHLSSSGARLPAHSYRRDPLDHPYSAATPTRSAIQSAERECI